MSCENCLYKFKIDNGSSFRLVPPEKPKIFNERGENVESGAGPYEEGGDLHLVCVVSGGECE